MYLHTSVRLYDAVIMHTLSLQYAADYSEKNRNLKRDKCLHSDDRNSNFGAPSIVLTVSIYYRQLGVTKSSGAHTILGLGRLFQYPDILSEFVMINNAALMYYGRAVIIDYVQSFHIIALRYVLFPTLPLLYVQLLFTISHIILTCRPTVR